MKVRAFIAAFIVILSPYGQCCYQASAPNVTIHSNGVSGVIIVRGKPWARAHLSLREPPGMIADGKFTKFTRKLASTDTDSAGNFSFPNVQSGSYTILMNAESLDVKLVVPKKDQNETVRVEFFADYCERAFVIGADGKVVESGTPKAYGAAAPSQN